MENLDFDIRALLARVGRDRVSVCPFLDKIRGKQTGTLLKNLEDPPYELVRVFSRRNKLRWKRGGLVGGRVFLYTH